jgi:hypothetical protein
MSTRERLSAKDRVAERTASLARTSAQDKMLSALAFFKNSPVMQKLPVATVDKLLTRIYDRELIRFTAQRERGLHNDAESIGPGLTALVTAEAVGNFASTVRDAPRRPGTLDRTHLRFLINGGASAERIAEIKGEPISDSEWAASLPSNSPLAPNFYPAEGEDLYSLRLSAGAYRHVDAGTGAEGVLFTTYATFSEGRMVNSYPAFKLPESGVVRIEGQSEGELWQNPAYTAEGELIAEH